MITSKITGSLRQIIGQERDALALDLRQGVDISSAELLAELRGQVVGAGLGQRLANAWRRRVYPDNSGRRTLSPAALIWTQAGTIIRAYNDGTLIRPRGGRRALAIPTDWVPLKARGGKGGGSRPMTPVEVEARFNRDLRYVPLRNGRAVLIMDQVIEGRSGGLRRATKGRRKQGRQVSSKIMFVLVRQVSVRKRLDIAGATDNARAALAGAIAASSPGTGAS